jgi:hypothetical protein
MATDAKTPKVFICYANQDFERAGEIADWLSDSGAEPWLDKRNLISGDNWELEIEQAVSRSDAFVVLLRPGFDEIGFRQKEVRLALEAAKRRPVGHGFIIPFVIEPCQLPVWCQPIHTPNTKSSRKDLVRAIEKHCGVVLAAGEQTEPRIKRLIDMLVSREVSEEDQIYAADSLGKIGVDAQSAVMALLKTLKSPNPKVCASAAGALGNIGSASKEAIPLLLERAKPKDEALCAVIIQSLGKIDRHCPEVSAFLEEMMKLHRTTLAQLACWALHHTELCLDCGGPLTHAKVSVEQSGDGGNIWADEDGFFCEKCHKCFSHFMGGLTPHHARYLVQRLASPP